MEDFYSQHFARSREASSYGKGEPASCAIKAEELRWSQEKRVELWSWRFCIPQGVTDERFASFQSAKQACAKVCWTIQDFGQARWSSLPIGIATTLSDVHDVFHVTQLKKCLRMPEEQIPMEDLDAKEDLSYQGYPIKILEMSERVTWNKRIKMCKV
jgi:hypothetical protein